MSQVPAACAWRMGEVPRDWCNAILVPIPTSVAVTIGGGWMWLARWLLERLQKVAEDELPESQCGFRRERSCADMIFTVRQLVEKAWEHKSSVYFTFVD